MAETRTIDGAVVRERWPLPNPHAGSDKEDRGRILVIGGAGHTPGALLLAGLAALRVGAGKLMIAAPEPAAIALAVAVPEAGVVGLPCTAEGAISPQAATQAADLVSGSDAVLLGPGMADPSATLDFTSKLLGRFDEKAVLVLDALAASCGILNDGLGDLARRTTITPNDVEAEYILGDADGDEADRATRIASRHRVTVALGSSVATPGGDCWRIPKGNAGLATSGSGDVLAGAVAGIAARAHDPVGAAAWGLLLHGTAGDRLAASVGQVGFLARELLDQLPRCLQQLAT